MTDLLNGVCNKAAPGNTVLLKDIGNGTPISQSKPCSKDKSFKHVYICLSSSADEYEALCKVILLIFFCNVEGTF